MVSRDVVSAAVLEQIAPLAIGLACRPVMDQLHIWESTRGPAEHVRFDFIHCVPAGSADEAPDLVPTLPTVNLGGAPDMEDWINFGLDLQGAVDLVADGAAADAELRVAGETVEALFKVIREK